MIWLGLHSAVNQSTDVSLYLHREKGKDVIKLHMPISHYGFLSTL